MPRLPASLLALGLAATVVGLVACGGEDAKLLPGETARVKFRSTREVTLWVEMQSAFARWWKRYAAREG